MARVTIEDCRKYIPNRFELVILAAQRAKDLSLGMPPLIQKTRDKDPVLSLREIAAGRIDCDKLRELVISKHINPMRRVIGGENKSAALDIDEIFKDLAVSAAEDSTNTLQDDEYYEGDVESLDDCCATQLTRADRGEDNEEDEEDEQRIQIKQQQFDIDIAFQDEDVED